jgi:hypothetical protein
MNLFHLRRSVVSMIGIFLLTGCLGSDAQPDDSFASVFISYTPITEDDAIDPTEWVLSLEGVGSQAALKDINLTLIDMFHYAAQDEYLARAEYALIIETFGYINPYVNIEKSEVQHLSLLKTLFDLYDQTFPVDPSEGHVVVPLSLFAAAEIGVGAEVLNIAMYDRFLSYSIPDNVFNVFNALKTASEHHLNAFQRQVDKY